MTLPTVTRPETAPIAGAAIRSQVIIGRSDAPPTAARLPPVPSIDAFSSGARRTARARIGMPSVFLLQFTDADPVHGPSSSKFSLVSRLSRLQYVGVGAAGGFGAERRLPPYAKRRVGRPKSYGRRTPVFNPGTSDPEQVAAVKYMTDSLDNYVKARTASDRTLTSLTRAILAFTLVTAFATIVAVVVAWQPVGCVNSVGLTRPRCTREMSPPSRSRRRIRRGSAGVARRRAGRGCGGASCRPRCGRWPL
jgi:hypothetical protein